MLLLFYATDDGQPWEGLEAVEFRHTESFVLGWSEGDRPAIRDVIRYVTRVDGFTRAGRELDVEEAVRDGRVYSRETGELIYDPWPWMRALDDALHG